MNLSSSCESCVLTSTIEDGQKILVCCYVDDITFAVSDPCIGESFLEQLCESFVIDKDEGESIEWLLGMSIASRWVGESAGCVATLRLVNKYWEPVSVDPFLSTLST